MSVKVRHLQMEISVGGHKFSLLKISISCLSFMNLPTFALLSPPSFWREAHFHVFLYFITLTEIGGGNKHFLPCLVTIENEIICDIYTFVSIFWAPVMSSLHEEHN